MKAKIKKVEHDYECEICGKIATKNVQTTWHEYDIEKDGDFKEVNSWDADENHFYCDKCYDKEMN